ncbi:DUF6029 family protein [Salinimicrobium flavum]|uniref:DUF6029 family protein n=1 Tax=Salinimicrobium flavum TaxID=1737065 RepID=A0ABW5ITC5_9FLAO
MKKTLFLLFLFTLPWLTFSQDTGNFYGSFESNSQWLQDDEGLDFTAPSEDLRSNNYFNLNFSLKNFTVGLQYEAYLPEPLLGYDPLLEGNEIATYFLNYKNENVEVTAGYFYEQFGSGLILRFWEDRQLGINNAMRGVRLGFTGIDHFDLTALYGEQRIGFETSEGTIGGIDANLDISGLMGAEAYSLSFGSSVVNRFQDDRDLEGVPVSVAAFSGRLNFDFGNFFSELEGVYKQPDVLVYNGFITNERKTFKGSAWLLNLGYAIPGFGINTTFRRLENFSFYSDRYAEGNQYNRQLIIYVPALTKQHDYLLNNIYVYSSQPRLLLSSAQNQAGETGVQADVYYSLPKETFFGGKYGTKLELNFSHWSGLDAEFDVTGNEYSSAFFSSGKNYFRELSLGIRKRWNMKWSGIYSVTDLNIDEGITVGSPLGYYDIQATIAIIENTYRFGKGRSARLELQHLWTEEDRGNWAGGLLEYNFTPALGIYAADSWNYGGEFEYHYYNFGGSYTHGSTRIALNYGRQRGGLICVGGVCRFVPENTGLSMNLQLSF